jgi:hypothetical protein
MGTVEPQQAAHAGPPGVLLAFVPWIVFWILVGNVDFGLACVIALAIVAFQTLKTVQAGEVPKVLELGTLVAFAVLTIIAYAGDEAWLERWFQPLSNGALLLIALVSVLIGKPFALQYAREQAPPEVQESPLFYRTTLIITWVWIAAFAVMTVSSLIPPIADGDSTMLDQDDTLSVVFYWVIPFIALAGAFLFTKWYPDEVRRRAREGARAAEA